MALADSDSRTSTKSSRKVDMRCLLACMKVEGKMDDVIYVSVVSSAEGGLCGEWGTPIAAYRLRALAGSAFLIQSNRRSSYVYSI